MGFRRLTTGAEIQQGVDSSSARDVYAESDVDANFDDELPVIGEAHPEISGIYVTSRQRRQWNGHDTKQLWDITYSTPSLENPPTESPATPGPDDLPTRVTIGAELLSLEDSELYFETSGDPVEQPLFLRVVTGTLTITEYTTDFAAKWATIRTLVGTVNNAAFWGGAFPKQTLLYFGASFTEKFDEDANKRWLVEHSWGIRNPTLGGGGIADAADGWNYIYDAVNKQWDMTSETVGGGGGRLYTAADHTTIIG